MALTTGMRYCRRIIITIVFLSYSTVCSVWSDQFGHLSTYSPSVLFELVVFVLILCNIIFIRFCFSELIHNTYQLIILNKYNLYSGQGMKQIYVLLDPGHIYLQ